VRFEMVWRGRAALTGDFLPRLLQPAPGWLAATACNGRGLVLNTVLGPSLAAFLRTGDAAALPLPVTPPRPIRARPLAALLPQLLLPLGDWQDRRAERQRYARTRAAGRFGAPTREGFPTCTAVSATSSSSSASS